MKKRRRLTDSEAVYLGFEIRKDKNQVNAKYTLNTGQLKTLFELRNLRDSGFKETRRTFNKEGEIISRVEKREQKDLIKIPENHQIKRLSTNTTTGQQWVITEPNKETSVEDFDFDSIIKKHIKQVEIKPIQKQETCDFETLTYTDVHIGMDTNKFDNSMYTVEWNESEIIKVANKMVLETIKRSRSNEIYIDELGDFLDGFNARTTRGGHELPQNMTNEKAFDVALQFKMILADNLVNHYKNITFNNICNDNHAGSFGYFVNKAFKDICKHKYPKIKVNNYRTFLSHYFVNDICFVITHGKDDSTLKFGFKPQLDTKQIEKIDQYLKHYKIYNKASKIIFKKGDSHQMLFDMCGSFDFDYYNYPALSPPSQWVQNNFGRSRRAYVLEYFTGTENEIKPIFIK